MGEINTQVVDKDVNSILGGEVVSSENEAQASNLGCLKRFNTISYSPVRMAKLQRADLDLGVGTSWVTGSKQVVDKDVNSILGGEVVSSVNEAQASNLGCLMQFNNTCYSPVRIAKLQRADPDLEVVITWVIENKRPSRDKVARYSPNIRNYWFNYDLLVMKDEVLFTKCNSILKCSFLKQCWSQNGQG
jgi:hypothetical protein